MTSWRQPVTLTAPEVGEVDQAWREYANCVGLDVEVFFPKKDTPGNYAAARRVCGRCDVRAECLRAGMLAEEASARAAGRQVEMNNRPYEWRHGMVGGLTPKERQALRNTGVSVTLDAA